MGRRRKYLGPSAVDTLISTQEHFLVPITSIAHESRVSEHDETERYVGKEILVVKKDYKGWRGTLKSVSQDKCMVAPGHAACITLDKNDVVVK